MSDISQAELKTLISDIDAFTNAIFDQVSSLGRVDFLHAIYDFKSTVEGMMTGISDNRIAEILGGEE